MIDHLDNLLRTLFLREIPMLTPETVRFQFPDEAWRSEVGNLNRMALNIYMMDVRENRKLRSNLRTRPVSTDGTAVSAVAPARLDCHYLITAWSPAQSGPAVEPTLDEHALLYRTAAVLLTYPLNPSLIYPRDSAALQAVPELIRYADLPAEILPVEGFPKQPEFWGSMGASPRWKPAIYLVVTLPVELPAIHLGSMVTTLITRYLHTGISDTVETFHNIGGQVFDLTNGRPLLVEGASVRLESDAGGTVRTTQTDRLGRFTFIQVPAGAYRLYWWADDYHAPPGPRSIQVPSLTGEYDLAFDTLLTP